jgi:transcriptional regulator with XRE-family HTH domain
VTRNALRKALDLAPIPPEGNRLRIALALLGQQQTAILAATGFRASKVSRLVRGKLAKRPIQPTEAEAGAIAAHFGVPVKTLWPNSTFISVWQAAPDERREVA